ncbi:telomerase protein component 1 [Esox lucius]|uniref:Telomerase associated protein 1 n=1 Tax=Esox lucius TaxID=8010 RepID=A0AAY5K682_ESOLU|nr:telomerase protein component 1 [Esox lucius]XP_010888185.2 telomerase protein component 1 [Esox lucius]
MKSLPFLSLRGSQDQQAGSGGLSSNYLGENMENKLLAQASVLPQALSVPLSWASQTSRLTSTTSTLLSTPSLTSPSLTSPFLTSSLLTSTLLNSPLVSTENKLLKRDSLLSSGSSSFPSPSSRGHVFPSALAPSCNVVPPTCLPPPVLEVEDGQSASEEVMSDSEEMSVDSYRGGLMAGETEVSTEMPVLELVLDEEELDPTIAIGKQEFGERERGKDELEEELKDKKYLLLNEVCCSLVNKTTAPGQKDWDAEDSIWKRIQNLAIDISTDDPQFLLKVAVYTRQELNIRITANFLLALAAHLPTTKPHVRRYFCSAVQLPSDWLEVVRLYSMCFSRSLPICLKKALGDKFKQFNEYQLAKYNTRKHCCKHNRSKQKSKKPFPNQFEKWGNMLGCDAHVLQKFLKMEENTVVDKKQSDFSLKKMIKRLHIKEPAQHVMAILGKRYPSDLKAFSRSGLSGVWDSKRAGQRMKLKQPDTWERMLSKEGNKASTWEKLIDSNSLPFMAMLRNLRNMITQGISDKHHQTILGRLTSQKAVIQSRQFPFRFLTAYKVIMELNKIASAPVKTAQSNREILKGILKKLPKGKNFIKLDWETAGRKRMRVALGVPFVSHMYHMKKSLLQKASQRKYSQALLARYRKALETAVQISCRYNVPPLPGRTMIFINRYFSDECWGVPHDFCCPSDPEPREGEEVEEKVTPTLLEVALLLSMIIAHNAEDPQLVMFTCSDCSTVESLKSDVLLENVSQVMKQVNESSDDEDDCQEEKISIYINREMTLKKKVDTIIMLSDNELDDGVNIGIDQYRKNVNNNALIIKIYLGKRPIDITNDRNCVKLKGFSEQILRFVAERGSSRLLEHVDNMDKLYRIPPPQGGAEDTKRDAITPLPATPSLRWRGVRVFVSSTFRDMQAERDVLVRSVFPELRRRAAQHCLYLQEVELRWGVTEEETGRIVELCLSEVCRSQLLIGILGERYGLVPPRPSFPDLPQYSWLDSAPSGLSITEMEIRQFQALHPDTVQKHMFCYFRTPHLSRTVPVAWRADFAPESKEAETKMSDLKRSILNSGAKVTESYPCQWGGIVDGKPYMKGLEDFGKAVLQDLWGALLKHFVEETHKHDPRPGLSEQEVHQGALQRQFFGRAKLLSAAVEQVQEAQLKGGMVLLEGAPGEGKTVFMAALAKALSTPTKSQKVHRGDVISYSTAASKSACTVENLLHCLVQWLWRGKEKEGSLLPSSYKDLLSEFHFQLCEARKDQPLALLVDGAELVQDGRGKLISDWIPQQLPQGVSLVLSVTSNSALLRVLAKKKRTILFPLGQLSLPDRKEIVQRGLGVHGKKLSDSAFNNQLQTLLMKKGAVSPLYLHLACEELRAFASFEKMSDSLQALPPSLSGLVQHSLGRLLSQYRDIGLGWALAALAVSRTGLKERDLYAILNICHDLTSGGEKATLQDMLHLARKPKRRVPMATFSHMVRSLHSLIDPSHCHGPDDPLALTNPEVRLAFKKELLLPGESDWTKGHLLMAAHLWEMADPQGTDTFLHCEASSILNLPFHLMRGGQWEALHCLLSSYHFLFAEVRNGLLHHLLETYSLFLSEGVGSSTSSDPVSEEAPSRLQDCLRFLQRHAPLLSSWPTLFLQQALNEPHHTAAHAWAQGMMGKEGKGVHVMRWLNNEQDAQLETSELVSTFLSEPTCAVVSPGGGVMAVGTGQGTLHLIHTETGQEVRSLVSSCDGISGCVFLREGLMGTTSFDGRIELWDVESGCRTSLIDGHSNRITGSDVSADRKHLATVSLDSSLKVWSSPKGSLVTALTSPSPLNCVQFDPEGHHVAAGGWDGVVRLWNWLKGHVTTLSGHRRAVRSLSFSPSSHMLCSGCLSGEVRLWSVPSATCVGHYQAHRGSTEVLTFLQAGTILLSASSDYTVKLWSGGLGRAVNVFEKKRESVVQRGRMLPTKEPAALCVAVTGGYAAVGYHGDGLKLFSLESGERTWESQDLQVSILCLMWLSAEEPKLLVSGGGDQQLRVWKKTEGGEAGMMLQGCFGVQQGPILSLAQNHSYLASASDDCSIGLWSVKDLTSDPWVNPCVRSVLRGHNGGVTCLAFSTDGKELLSGGKDQALMVWKVSSSPPALVQSLPHCHGDWITGCAWGSDCVMSCSSDCKIRLWDLKKGHLVREILGRSSLSAICCLGEFVIAGCAEGDLHVWKWDSGMEISRISAHKSRIHHCSVLPDSDETQKTEQKDMVVATASDDGTVKLWQPFQVQHHSTLQGHSGGIHGVVAKQNGVPAFLTVSEDRSLRTWSVSTAMECPPNLRGAVTAVCISQSGDLLLSGYESGRVEIWKHTSVVGSKQVSASGVTAICFMPEGQFAVGCRESSVSVWKLEWNPQHNAASLLKVSTHSVPSIVSSLHFCTILLGICDNGDIVNVLAETANERWCGESRFLGLVANDEKSTWLVGEKNGNILLCFVFAMGQQTSLYSSCVDMELALETGGTDGWLSAGTVNRDLVVCGDSKGNMWFNQPPNVNSWSRRKPAHSDRISVLRVTDDKIISASHDRTVKMWDRETKKQVGLFVCGAPVLVLELNPHCCTELVCGDAMGELYLLSWRE